MTITMYRSPFTLAVLLVGNTAISSLVSAQAVATLRIPHSAVESYAPQACTIKTTKVLGSKESSARDTLHIRIENDQNLAASSKFTLRIRIDSLTDSIVTGASSASVAADSGQHLTVRTIVITREPGAQLVCAATFPTLAATDDEMTVQRAMRVGVGASFNFLSGVSSTDLYSDATVFFPVIWPTKNGTFGIDAGIVNARTVREDTLGDGRHYWILGPPTTDSLTLIEQRRSRQIRRQLDRLGLYIAPTYRIASHLYLVVQGELFNNTIAETSISQTVGADTMHLAHGDRRLNVAPRRVARDSAITTIDSTRVRYSVFEPFVGAGLIVSYRLSDVEFRTKPIIGYGEPFGRGGPYYAVQFRVTDFENGFKLGGEVRGLLTGTQTSVLVYLAKDFGLKRLASFLVGGDKEN